MTSEQDTDYYDHPDVVAAYEAARERGLCERERRAIDRHFDPEGRVLDLGCGAGRTSAVLTEEGYETVGLDISRPMLGLAAAADPEVSYVASDAARLPFGAESFPIVLFSHNGLDELRPESMRVQALREVYRVLVPGGHFAFSSHNILRRLLPLPPTRYWLGKLARFWWENLSEGNLGSPYKRIDDAATIHFTDPLSVVRLVRAVGFDVVELVGNGSSGSTLFGNCVFVVAQKPKRARISRQ